MKTYLNRFLKKINLELISYPSHDILRRMHLMKMLDINVLFDIGANIGQYATDIRNYGYKGKIFSFEPINDVFEELNKNALNDKEWSVFNYAIGNADEKSVINIAQNSFSSSLLRMLPNHLKSAPESQYVSKQEIIVKAIDSIFQSLCTSDDKVMLKIDTQGYEKNVIDGAQQSLKHIKLIQLEMSLQPLYENELLMCEMIKYLDERNFELFSIENGYSDYKTRRLMQVDGIFVKKGLV